VGEILTVAAGGVKGGPTAWGAPADRRRFGDDRPHPTAWHGGRCRWRRRVLRRRGTV